jgi:hypothetical protein
MKLCSFVLLSRAIAHVAIAVVLVATICPATIAAAVRPIQSLTPSQRLSLPATTMVKLKTGRTVSLGTLRVEHKLRIRRFADAARLGAQRGVHLQQGRGARASQTALVPMNFSTQYFTSPKQTLARGYHAYQGPLPADFLAFCKGARVTACLYVPAGVELIDGQANAVDFDPLITDPQVCASGGGVFPPGYSECIYYYPSAYTLEFNPGQTTLKQSGNCPTPFSKLVDPHGAVTLFVPAGNGSYVYATLKSCVVRIFVSK